MNLFTVEQVAEKLNIPVSTILTQVKIGALKCIRMGNNTRISEDTLNEFLAAKVAAYQVKKRTPKKNKKAVVAK